MVVTTVELSKLRDLDDLTTMRTNELEPTNSGFGFSAFVLRPSFLLARDSEEVEVLELEGVQPLGGRILQERFGVTITGLASMKSMSFAGRGEASVVVVTSIARVLDSVL